MNRTTKMTLTLRRATPADSPGITQVHTEAFADGVISQRVFPPCRLTEDNWAADLASYFTDPKTHLLVVTDDSTTPPQVIGFAKWSEPRAEGTPAPPRPTDEEIMDREWPPEVDLPLARAFLCGMAAKRASVMGDARFWFLHILVVKPEHQGRGAGGMMIRWGAERADGDGAACYLDSTTVAKGVYERYGFREVDRLVLEGQDHGGEDLVESMMVRDAKG